MTTTDPDRLYELVPVVYRLRDADRGYPLRALLRVIAEQVDVVERDIAGLYENFFIETCADWVVPYIGALIGYAPLGGSDAPTTAQRAQVRERITVPRREVANTIRFRRRKGTPAVLEELAAAVAGWPARAVEFYRLLAVTQNAGALRMDRGRTADIRDGDAMYALGTAFDELARNIDVRTCTSPRTRGTFNVPAVGVFVWRMRAYTVTNTPAYNYDKQAPNCYLFSPLGIDMPLFANPRAAGADPALPLRITRRGLETRELDESGRTTSGVPYFYGPGKSFAIATGTPPVPVPAESIVPADLTDWTYRPLPGQVAVDPVLGRIVFPPPTDTRRPPVWVSYTYGFSADLGGGEYERALSGTPDTKMYRVGAGARFASIGDARAQWQADAPPNAAIEIVDSGVYAEPIAIELAAGQTLQLRAANRTKPMVRLLDWQKDVSGFSVSGAPASWFVLDGITVTGRGMQISGELSGVTIRHATLVPGWGLGIDSEPLRPTEASLEVIGAPLCVTIENSIVGAIQVERDEVKRSPLRLRISDSIVDATSSARVALGAAAKRCADVVLNLQRSTVIGQIQTHAVELAENSIVTGVVHVCRRQWGCMRFCYLPPGSHTPRRYECQPDLVEEAVTARYAKDDFDPEDRDAMLLAERLRVEPSFESTRYGKPEYARLTRACAPEIATGADDDSELGVFHDLYEPQRAANLRRRLDEYTPAGTDAGIIYAS
jgi:hypothetical protein